MYFMDVAQMRSSIWRTLESFQRAEYIPVEFSFY